MRWLILRTTDFTDGQYDAVYDLLSPSRRAHIDSFRHPGARRQSLAGELALRTLLEREGIDAVPERLPSGQPVLPGSGLHVSISHCDDLVACAISGEPIGIDVEKLRPVKPAMIQRVCTPEELSWVGGDPDRFFQVWTAKEAYFKMAGTGITDLRSVNTLALPRLLLRRDEYLIQLVYMEKR